MNLGLRLFATLFRTEVAQRNESEQSPILKRIVSILTQLLLFLFSLFIRIKRGGEHGDFFDPCFLVERRDAAARAAVSFNFLTDKTHRQCQGLEAQ